MTIREIKIGSMWWDKYNTWSNGDVDDVYVVLSADTKDGKYYYAMAQFMWINKKHGYCGAPIREFLDYEVFKMVRVGNIKRIPLRIKIKELLK